MARLKRLKSKEEEFFLIMSVTVGQEFYIGDVEKEEGEEIIFMTTARQKV
jgi:hypothetical protein